MALEGLTQQRIPAVVGPPDHRHHTDAQGSLLHEPADIAFLVLTECKHDFFLGLQKLPQVFSQVFDRFYLQLRFIADLNKLLNGTFTHPTHSPIVIFVDIIHNDPYKNQ